MSTPLKRKLAAILSADMVGYSAMMAQDEESTISRLQQCRGVIDELIEAYHGRIVGTAGDSVLAEFTSAVEAVRAATEIQDALKSLNRGQPENRQMLFRIGINVGDVFERDGDLLGDGVNVAARLQALAQPGGINIAGSVYDQIQGKLNLQFDYDGERQLKNIPRPVHVFTHASGETELRAAALMSAEPEAAQVAAGEPRPSRRLTAKSLVAAGLAVLVLLGSITLLGVWLRRDGAGATIETVAVTPPGPATGNTGRGSPAKPVSRPPVREDSANAAVPPAPSARPTAPLGFDGAWLLTLECAPEPGDSGFTETRRLEIRQGAFSSAGTGALGPWTFDGRVSEGKFSARGLHKTSGGLVHIELRAQAKGAAAMDGEGWWDRRRCQVKLARL